jgi:hypothetical protein
MKTKTIKLMWNEAFQKFRVSQVTNSVEYKAGDMLSKRDVEDLCNSPRWQVVTN